MCKLIAACCCNGAVKIVFTKRCVIVLLDLLHITNQLL